MEIGINKIILLIWEGFKLFFILPIAMLSQKVFNYFWNKYYMINIPKSIFNLCVQWLLYKGNKYNLSYETINVLIFCLIWPFITLWLLFSNIYLLIKI